MDSAYRAIRQIVGTGFDSRTSCGAATLKLLIRHRGPGLFDTRPPYYGPAPAVAFPLRHVSTPKPNEWLRKHRREMVGPLPTVCVLHGQEGTRTRKWNVPSHPHIPFDDYSIRQKILHEFIHARSDSAFSQRRKRLIRATSRWTLCPACQHYRSWRRVLTLTLLTLTALVVTARLNPLVEWLVPEPFLSLTLIGGAALLIPTMRSLSTAPEVARALVSEDGTELLVHNPHPEFARQAIELGAEARSDMSLPTNMYGLRPIM